MANAVCNHRRFKVDNLKPSWQSLEGILQGVMVVAVLVMVGYITYQNTRPVDPSVQQLIVAKALEAATTFNDILAVSQLTTRAPLDIWEMLQPLALLFPGLLSLGQFTGKRTGLKQTLITSPKV
jgi:hypothetical protein